MANTAQAKKRARQNETHRRRNASARSMMRTYIKKVIKSIESNDKESALTGYRFITGLLDRFAAKGLIHKNKAARHKSRLNKRIKEMGQSA